MRAPEFWRRRAVTAFTLLPLAAGYSLAGRLRWAATRPWHAEIPVVCAGNLVAGGAGKTPLAMALASWFLRRGRAVHFLTRGYRGRQRGPLRVDTASHTFRDVGDEALLLAGLAPTWVARDRPAGARAAQAAGAEIIVMDDGFQNPGLHKDLSLIAIDGGYGFGNALVLPAGPLREPLSSGFARAQGAVMIGEDVCGAGEKIPPGLPVLRARLAPGPEAEGLAGKPLVAFAGIGRPDKFFDSLRALGCELLDAVPFPDHHVYKPDEVMWLVEMAAAAGARPVTTLKDYVRLPEEAKPMIDTLSVTLEWADEAALDGLLSRL
ncbi:MAG: tetraacyldisaccharide 4'-kinase [Alphaproteobacteria bacterium]